VKSSKWHLNYAFGILSIRLLLYFVDTIYTIVFQIFEFSKDETKDSGELARRCFEWFKCATSFQPCCRGFYEGFKFW
jgi:hypothetical protein